MQHFLLRGRDFIYYRQRANEIAAFLLRGRDLFIIVSGPIRWQHCFTVAV